MTPSQRDLLYRCALATIPLAGVVWLSLIARDSLLALIGVFPCLGVVALIITPSLTAVAGQSVGSSLYFPEGKQPPRAPLSEVDALLVAEQWEAADKCLIALAREYPHDVEVWARLFKLAWAIFCNHERAEAAHRLALRSVADRDLWDRLNHLYLLYGQSYLGIEDKLERETAAVQRRTQVAAINLSRRNHRQTPFSRWLKHNC